MKVLFVSGCPRSSTSFYSRMIFYQVPDFYVDFYVDIDNVQSVNQQSVNDEPICLNQILFNYYTNVISKNQCEEFVVDFFEKQNRKEWIVCKHPFFSFAYSLLNSMPFEKKFIITQRNFHDTLKSQLNYKDSISLTQQEYDKIWLSVLENDSYKTKWSEKKIIENLKIFIKGQMETESKIKDNCFKVNYGENPILNKSFIEFLNLNSEQIEIINKNYLKRWKDENYSAASKSLKKEAKKYRKQIDQLF